MLKEFVALTMVAMEIGERHFSYQCNSCRQNKIFHQKRASYTFEITMIKLNWLDKHLPRKNYATLKRFVLRKSAKKLKTILYFMTTFHNFAFKIDPSCAARVV